MYTRFTSAWRVLLCTFFTIISSYAQAATYYVSPVGNDSNDGSANRPWATLQRAADATAAGDTVLIADGNYTGGLTQRTSGLSGAPITFRAVNPGGPVLWGDPVGRVDEIWINRSHHVVIDGLTIRGANRGIRVDNSNNCTIRRCTVVESVVTGIFTNYSDDVLIEYNEAAFSAQQHGIYVSNGGDRPLVRYNVCHDNPRAGIQLNGDGKQVQPALGTRGDGIIENGQIIGNICYNNGLQNMASAMNILCVRSTLVANNLIYNNLAGGISFGNDNLASEVQFGSKFNRVINNTVYFRPDEGRWCLSATHGSVDNVVENNILFGGYRGAYQIDSTSNFIADFNLLPTYGVVGVATDADIAEFYTLPEWQVVTGNDYNSSQIDPQFVSCVAAPYDFHVSGTSAAINRGVWHEEVPIDIDGNARPPGGVSDIGCYQTGTPVTYSVSGRVLCDGQGVGGVSVSAAAVRTTSAPDGSYTLLGLPAGTYVVGANNGGYICPVLPTVTIGPSITGVDLVVSSLLSGVAIQQSSVPGTVSATGTVYLVGPAPSGGSAVALTSSNTAVATVPSSVTVPEGATQATFTITTKAVASDTSVSITVALGAATASASLTVTPPTVSTISLSPSTVTGGTSSTGTVTLTSAAAAGGAVVSLASTDPCATTPATVTVAGGSKTATFTVQTTAVAADTSSVISGSLGGGSAAANLIISPTALKSLSLSPTTVAGGMTSTGTVTLTGAAPAGGTVVSLTSSSSAASVPATVTVASGATSATFTVQTSGVAADTSATIRATFGTITASAGLTIKPPAVSTATLSPASVTGGTSSSVTVTLTGPAPTGGASVKLTSSSSNATVPATVTVPAGATTATATVTTKAVTSDTSATISATFGGVTAAATLSIKKTALSSVSVSPSTITGGYSATGTVALTGPAPAGGVNVSLNEESGAVRVPDTVFIAAGASSATFKVTTKNVTRSRQVVIYATYGGTTKQTTITVN